jgi:tetratricopeptide (TPR) repeat protein
MKKYILLISLFLQLLPATAIAQNQEPKNKSFSSWCIRRNELELQTSHTINMVLDLLKTNDCKIADSLLRKKKTLKLSNSGITDVSPLAGLSDLAELNLNDNEISNIEPLANLSSLEYLSLENNNISRFSNLIGIHKKLNRLNLSKNRITDISELSILSELQELDISDNKITNLVPIVALPNLAELNFSNNSIQEINKVDGLTNLISSPTKVKTGNTGNNLITLPVPSSGKDNSLHIMPIQLMVIYIGLFLIILLIIFLRGSSNNEYPLQILDIPVFQESNQESNKSKAFNDIFAIDPFYKNDWLAVGEAMHNLLAYQLAVDAYDRYLSIDPDNYVVWKKRGKSLAELCQYDDAIKSYQSALKIKDVNEYDDAHEAWLETLRLDELSEIDDLRSFLGCQDSLQFLEQN